jgi:MFS family permease
MVQCLSSPLTANIYLPAIPTIAAAFNKSIELINLTVTVYMVLQGVSPMLWGLLADYLGRRPIFLACLLVLSAACIGLALVPTSDYWLLMLLRCIQAAGSASTVALGVFDICFAEVIMMLTQDRCRSH